MTQRTRIIFAGSGGQGVITASIILAESAVLHEGLHAVQTQLYGAAARGGATRADVIIADSPINYPKVEQANCLLCLSQEAYERYCGVMRPGGMLLLDSRFVRPRGGVDARQIPLALYDSVMAAIGIPVVLNMCALGAVVTATGLVTAASAKAVLPNHVPPAFLEQNLRAFEIGAGLVADSGRSFPVSPPQPEKAAGAAPYAPKN